MRHGRNAWFRIVVGPMADVKAARELVEGETGLEIRETGSVREQIRDAAAVVSTGGYNSSALLISTDLPVVFIPVVRDQGARPRAWLDHPAYGSSIRPARSRSTGWPPRLSRRWQQGGGRSTA